MSDSNELRAKWFGCRLIWDSNDFGCFLLSIDLRFKWFGCQSMCASNDFGCLLIWTSSDVVVKCFEIQVIRLSIDLRFKWFGCQSIWDSNELVVNWFEIQVIWMSNDLRFKWFGCQLMCDSNDFVKRSFSARRPSKTKLCNSKTKLFCETSFKMQAFEMKNEAFLRDFLQKRSISARLPSKLTCWADTWPQNSNTFLMIFKWMLQKYCACHEKVEPRHTKSCNCHAKLSLQSNTSVTWNLQPFHSFSAECFKHRHHKPQNPCACHAKPIVSDPLQIHHACQRFCDPDELLRLPRSLQRVEIPAPATRNRLSTSKNVPSPWCFNDFDFRIVRVRRRGANFVELNFQKCSDHATL